MNDFRTILIQILNKISSDDFDWTFKNKSFNDETMDYDYLHVQSAIIVLFRRTENFVIIKGSLLSESWISIPESRFITV